MTKTSTIEQPPVSAPAHASEPSRDCPLCPRLAAFRNDNRKRAPDWFNAPVPSFGGADAQLLIVGLAPGLQGANRTGNFTPRCLNSASPKAVIRRGRTMGFVWSAVASAMPCAASRRRTSRRQQKSIPAAVSCKRSCAQSSCLAASRMIRRSRRWGCVSRKRRSATAARIRPIDSGCSIAITARATTRIRAC